MINIYKLLKLMYNLYYTLNIRNLFIFSEKSGFEPPGVKHNI